MKLFIVGLSKLVNNSEEWKFEVVGVFDSEEKALSACKTDLCFIGPVELNKDYGIDTLPDWEGCYYPLREDKR